MFVILSVVISNMEYIGRIIINVNKYNYQYEWKIKEVSLQHTNKFFSKIMNLINLMNLTLNVIKINKIPTKQFFVCFEITLKLFSYPIVSLKKACAF